MGYKLVISPSNNIKKFNLTIKLWFEYKLTFKILKKLNNLQKLDLKIKYLENSLKHYRIIVHNLKFIYFEKNLIDLFKLKGKLIEFFVHELFNQKKKFYTLLQYK